MYITRINIESFGKLSKLDIKLDKGLNIIFGENESGKTTLFSFIHACFYGLSSNDRNKFIPWETDISFFGGEIYFELNNIKYLAKCRFGNTKRQDSSLLFNNVTGETIFIPSGQTIGEYILELTEGAFDSSVYTGQLESRINGKKDKTGNLLSRIISSQGFGEDSVNVAEKRLKEAMDGIKAPRGTNGVLDRMYIIKKDIENELRLLKESEGRLSITKNEYDSLIQKKENIINEIKLSDALFSLKKRKVILEKMAMIDKIHDDIKNAELKSKKNISKIIYVVSFIIFCISLVVYFSHISTELSILLLFSCMFTALWAAVKGKNNTPFLPFLKQELVNQENQLDQIMGNRHIAELEEEWRESEKLLSTHNKKEYPDPLQLKKELDEISAQAIYKKAIIESESITDEYAGLIKSHKEITDKIEYYEDKYMSMQIAKEVLSESFTELQTTFGPAISNEAGKILDTLTDGAHNEIRVSREFDVNLFESNGMRTSQTFSGGTIDQIYLALRLAMTKVISSNVTLPVFLDDAFVQYDDNRLKNAIELLHNYTQEFGSQIILSGCQKRILLQANNLQQINVITLVNKRN